jgi:hypothetical protein
MYTIFSAVQRQQRKSDVMTSFGLVQRQQRKSDVMTSFGLATAAPSIVRFLIAGSSLEF